MAVTTWPGSEDRCQLGVGPWVCPLLLSIWLPAGLRLAFPCLVRN